MVWFARRCSLLLQVLPAVREKDGSGGENVFTTQLGKVPWRSDDGTYRRSRSAAIGRLPQKACRQQRLLERQGRAIRGPDQRDRFQFFGTLGHPSKAQKNSEERRPHPGDWLRQRQQPVRAPF